jgi:S-adenosylmethionine:tRNA ribosyltransferase-isomerase
MDSFQALLSSFDYAVPPELVAAEPVHPRDSAKLFVYDRMTEQVTHAHFSDIGAYLPRGTVLVCNDTRVIPARLQAHTPSGKEIEVFVTSFVSGGTGATILSNRNVDEGDELHIAPNCSVRILKKSGKETAAELMSNLSWHEVLDAYGHTPIPPYLQHTKLTEAELREEYQTVFAKHEGSVAAPTASLHFTEDLLERLKGQGVQIVFVTLHVNLGTFAPLSRDAVTSGTLHREYYNIPEESASILTEAKKKGAPIIPVGTTALRTIESAFNSEGECVQSSGATSIFIQEGYEFKMASGLITNFHVPQSSLMMLVAALIGREKLLELYGEAIRQKYRLFSFGDGMLIL